MVNYSRKWLWVSLLLLSVMVGRANGQWRVTVNASLAAYHSGTGGASCFVNGILWMGTGSLWSSSDTGRTWLSSSNAPVAKYYDITFIDSTDGAIATDAGLYITRDGGQNWALKSSLSFSKVSFIGSPELLGAVGDGFYLSQNGGVSWQCTLSYPGSAFSFAVAPDKTLYLLSGDWTSEVGSVKVSTDLGQTWIDRGAPVDVDAWTLAVDSCDSKRLYLADEQYWAWTDSKDGDGFSKIMMSTDGGFSWQI
jgi:photosystem II stability/assembly factor-like uncharacterized protein